MIKPNSRPKHIAHGWSMLAQCLHLAPGTVQFIEMERAFHAGAWMVLHMQTQMVDGGCSDDDWVQVIADLNEEADAFRTGVMQRCVTT